MIEVLPYDEMQFGEVDALWRTVFPEDPPHSHAAVTIPRKLAVQRDLFLVAFGLLLAGLLIFWRVRISRFGAALQAARQNELRVAAIGIEPFPIRLVAFVLSAMITAVAGAMFAELNRFASPSMLAWPMSGELIVLIILGGTGRLAGPVAGAMLYVMLEYWLGALTERWQFFLGLTLLGVVLFARGGIVGLIAGKLRHG